MFSFLPKILTGVAVAAVLASIVLGGLVLKYRGDWVEAKLLNSQLGEELAMAREEAELVDKLNQRRLAELSTANKKAQESINVIVKEPDDGCLDRPIPSAIADRLFPQTK